MTAVAILIVLKLLEEISPYLAIQKRGESLGDMTADTSFGDLFPSLGLSGRESFEKFRRKRHL